ncbi:MAG: Ig-like domain-containing protein, partial [Clostridia bacterium]|nr:Ig-like domain-containing protein [Clostridia bacterium]
MKKMKALFLALALMFTVGVTATVAGCKKNEGNESSVEEGFGNSEEGLASVMFDRSEVSVYQYEEVALICAAKGTDETIVYTSADETVATVDANGKVTAKDKVGSVKITATAGEASATCTVKVEKSPYHPQIVLQATEYTLEEGNTLEFNVATEWNNQTLSEGVEYAVSFVENSQNAKASISIEGNMIKVVAATVESFDVIVSATARGLYTSQQLTVNVVAPKLKLLPMLDSFVPADSKYEATISSTDLVGNMANKIPLDIVAVKGGQEV